MNKQITLLIFLLPSIVLASLPGNNKSKSQNEESTMTKPLNSENEILAPEKNPLLEKWTGPYGGIPPFDKVKISDFKSALETSMKTCLDEVDKIAVNTATPTFENTLAAMERSGQELDRVQNIYGVWSSTMNSGDFQSIERDMAPKLAEISDKIYQNEKLFLRIEAVYNSPEKNKLTPEQQRLVYIYYTNFVLAGAKVGPDAKTRLTEINQKLAGYFTSFSQNLLADEGEQFVILKDESYLTGLPQSVRDGFATAAESKNLKGTWIVNNTRSSVDPFLTYSDRRDLREKAWKMFVDRGDTGNEHDNNKIISEILKLREERAIILGFPNHASWHLQNTMAKDPKKAMELMRSVWKPAVERVKEEVADMQALANKENTKITIEPWDYRYYAEKVRKAKYDFNQNEVKEYLQLEKLREGMFWVAGELFNFEFTPVTNVPVYHPDVRVWEVKDKTSGKHIGLWYFDAYAREGKRSGAWMNAYRNQKRIDGEVTTIVSNNSNFVKGKPGEPVLISWDDASTLFHEFGHALHGLSSNVTYPLLSGTNVVRDYVEFPSQLLEHWLPTPEVLSRYALHYKTGNPIPKELVSKIEKASTFNEGFTTVEYLASAIVDMKIHTTPAKDIDPDKFETDILTKMGMPHEIVMRHRLPQFAHIFSSDDYSAGYYSYLWSDVLTADAYSAFVEAGSPYNKKIAERLSTYVFSVGNTIDPEIGFKTFRGRDAKTDALMIQRGFPVIPENKTHQGTRGPKPKETK